MRVYWFKGEGAAYGNFGDWLTKYLIERFTDHQVVYADHDVELFGCGSIIEAIPEGYTGKILSSGIMHALRSRPDLKDADIICLRGPLTAKRMGVETAYADLGLLCRLIKPEVPVEYDIGFIPHYADNESVLGHRIDITAGIETVMEEVAKCKRVVSSSLHGLVLADAFGIPNMWKISDSIMGDGFKYMDYGASLGEAMDPTQWRLGNQYKIQQKAVWLEETIRRL